MERKRLIALTVIVIIVVGFLGWYFLFGQPQEEVSAGTQLYIDGNYYNSTTITWSLTAAPGTTAYQAHTVINNGSGSATVRFIYEVSRYNGTQFVQLYNGTRWLVTNPNVTVSLVYASNTLAPWYFNATAKTGEQATYAVTFGYTDEALVIQFQYLGVGDPTVDGETVIVFLGLDSSGGPNGSNSILDAQDKAFNFTNNLNRAEKNMLSIYNPASPDSWNATPASTYGWNENVSSTSVPINIAISNDRKNVTMGIPYSYIGAQKDQSIRLVLQAFGRNIYPAGASQTTLPTPDQYYSVSLVLQQPTTPFTLPVPQGMSIKFYFKVVFSSTASNDYSFAFRATATSQV